MAVYQFFGKNKSYWNYIFADIVLTCIPAVSYTHLDVYKRQAVIRSRILFKAEDIPY